MTHTLLLAAHPDLRLSRVNKALLQAAQDLATRQPGRLEVRDLYARYPDYAIDVRAEQAAAEAADLIVWLHPIHWYAMPPLMKLWLDEVLTLGWAYGHGGRALAGKDLWLVASTGGHEEAYRPDGYNRYFFDAFLPPYDQTATLCGMRMLPPMLLHGAHGASDAEIAAHAGVFAQRLADYPAWPELQDLPECTACEIADADRPHLTEQEQG